MCSHCTRDLVLFKPLALRLQDTVDEVEQLKAKLQKHSDTLAQLTAQSMGNLSCSPVDIPPDPELAAVHGKPVPFWPALYIIVVLTIMVIGFCHWVLLFVYDAPPLFLRLLTITLPALTGYLCTRQSRLGWPWQASAALLVGAGAVWLMLAITAHLDAVPLWPSNMRDWREAFEYMTSISLSFLTGFLIHRLVLHWTFAQRRKINLQILLARDENGKYKIAEVTHQVQSLVTAIAPIVSAGTALYSGLKIFIGN